MRGPEPTANETNAIIWPELWAAFASHRDAIKNILCSLSRGPDTRLCVWGAGRTTDLDLIELVKHFAIIDLVDLDPETTQAALVQRGFDQHPQVNSIGMDVTALGDHWDRFRESPSEDGLREIIDSCQQTKLNLGEYDVVASTCLLSQLVRHAFEAIEGSGLPFVSEICGEVIRAIREQHLDSLLDHTASGGSAVLIADLTSAEALPEMLAPKADLNRLVSNDIAQGNHFHGMNPMAINETTNRPRIAAKLSGVQLSSPWIWNSIESQYLCLAFRLARK